jgi:hypothetical protein
MLIIKVNFLNNEMWVLVTSGCFGQICGGAAVVVWRWEERAVQAGGRKKLLAK